jgi:YegS/Rv2252/BmrU family lipid kinase
MHYTFILNPNAGNGTARKKRSLIENVLRTERIDYDMIETTAPAHAVELARAAAIKSDAVVAIGGDGTIQEVVRGLIAARALGDDKTVAFGAVPLGTGNDFVKMLHVSSNPTEAVQTILKAEPVQVDYGVVDWVESGQKQTRVFVNAVGVGFDARASIEVERFKFLPGTMAYLAAVLKTLGSWSSPEVKVSVVNGEDASSVWYNGSLLLANVGNGRCVGGGFYLTPNATITDGLFDICIVEGVGVMRILNIIPKALRGKHLNEPEVHFRKVSAVRIDSSEGLPVHADGEIVAHNATQIDLQIVEQGLTVLAPVR